MLKFISNEPNENESLCEAIYIRDDIIQKKKRNSSKISPKHTLQIKRHKISVDYRNKSFDDSKLMILDPPPNLYSQESKIPSGSIGISSENQSNEVISYMVLTHILKHWDESNTHSYPSSISMTPPEHISLKLCSIILK